MAYYKPAVKTLRRPARCPSCKHRRPVIVGYKDGSKVLECPGCNSVLQERAADLAQPERAKQPAPPKPAPVPDILGALSVEDDGHLEHEGKIWITDERGLCVAELESSEEAIIDPSAALRNAILLSLAPQGVKLARFIEQQFGEAIQTGGGVDGVAAVEFITRTLYPLALEVCQRDDEREDIR